MGRVGLGNSSGNECYITCCIQGLRHTRVLFESLDNEGTIGVGSVTDEVCDILKLLEDGPDDSFVSIKRMYTFKKVLSQHLVGFEEDSQNSAVLFMNEILKRMHLELGGESLSTEIIEKERLIDGELESILLEETVDRILYQLNSSTEVSSLLMGLKMSIHNCRDNHKSINYQDFFLLCLDLHGKGQKVDLNELLRRHFLSEGQPSRIQCSESSCINKTRVIHHLVWPNLEILPICLKRVIGERTPRKNRVQVLLPFILNLSAYLSVPKFPEKLRELLPQLQSVSNPLYRLVAVIQHQGSKVESGHYTVLARDTSNPSFDQEAKWYKYDDHLVFPTSIDEHKQYGILSSNCEIAIYVKISNPDKNTIQQIKHQKKLRSKAALDSKKTKKILNTVQVLGNLQQQTNEQQESWIWNPIPDEEGRDGLEEDFEDEFIPKRSKGPALNNQRYEKNRNECKPGCSIM